MKLYARMALLMVLLVLLPALPAAWMARELVTRSLNLGLSEEVDVALEAGVREAREVYQHQRRILADSLAAWAAAGQPAGRAPGDRVELHAKSGEVRILHATPDHVAPDAAVPNAAVPNATATDATVPEAVGPGGAAAGAGHGETPPLACTASLLLPDSSLLVAHRWTDPQWRADAQALATALQAVRGLTAERERLERGFWLPFLLIYAVSVVAALAAAAFLARGIIVPLQRLLEATRQIGSGRWDVRVPVRGRDEIASLSTQFNRMVQSLDAQSRRLVDLETMEGWREMARALAHEVKNPLTPIQLTVEEIRERYPGGDREYAALLDECTRIIVQEVESLRNVVGRFREFSRPVEPKFAPIDLNALVSDIGSLQRDMDVELDLAREAGMIRADADRLRQMLMNLARNAQAATAGRDGPRLRLATRPAGERVVLVVEDNGPGIPAAQRERVFEPYRSGSKGGLGLGLALVKGIVLAHGGSIRVEDGHWGGARFAIELPRDPETSHA